MNWLSVLRKTSGYSSVSWHASETMPGVRYAIRRVSLRQRIELTEKVRDLTMKYEFLMSGDASSQVEAALSDLLVTKLYLEWGLEKLEGLSIDGKPATAPLLIQSGPENLADEIVLQIQAESSLTDDEAKNS